MQSSAKPGILCKDKKNIYNCIVFKKKSLLPMQYSEFEMLISTQRLARYKAACNNDTRRTYRLYRANIRLSRAFLAVLSIFEVVLRNKIDLHYKTQFEAISGTPDWLLATTLPGGCLTANGCQNSLEKVTKCYTELESNYTHDRLLAKLSFGFWKHCLREDNFMQEGILYWPFSLICLQIVTRVLSIISLTG